MNPKIFIGKRIQDLRKSKNLSLKDLSLLIERPLSYLQRIENGNMYPKIKEIETICNIFEISISTFFDKRINYPIKFETLLKILENYDEESFNKTIDFIIAFSRKD